MRIIKKLLLALLVLVGALLLVAGFGRKDYAVSREVVINKSQAELFEYLKYLKNQDNFSVWDKMDLDMKKSYSGTDGTVGFISAWESQDKNVGSGEQEIEALQPNSRIDFEIRFKEPFQSTDKAYMTLEPLTESQTKVNWGIEGRMGFPTNLFLILSDMEGMIGRDLQGGLDNLKTIMED